MDQKMTGRNSRNVSDVNVIFPNQTIMKRQDVGVYRKGSVVCHTNYTMIRETSCTAQALDTAQACFTDRLTVSICSDFFAHVPFAGQFSGFVFHACGTSISGVRSLRESLFDARKSLFFLFLVPQHEVVPENGSCGVWMKRYGRPSPRFAASAAAITHQP